MSVRGMDKKGESKSGRLSPSEEERRFIDLLVESFVECMRFGDSILRFLELKYGLKKNDILRRPESFILGLKDLMGGGAAVIERLMIENLYRKIGLECEWGEKTFREYIVEAFEEYIRREENKRNLRELNR